MISETFCSLTLDEKTFFFTKKKSSSIKNGLLTFFQFLYELESLLHTLEVNTIIGRGGGGVPSNGQTWHCDQMS